MTRPIGFKRCRPHCPIHGVQLLVGRTVGELQYRYCTVPGCRESTRTKRDADPSRRVEIMSGSEREERLP